MSQKSFEPVALQNGDDPYEYMPLNNELPTFEKHRLRIKGGEIQVNLYLNEDKENPIAVDPWTDPEFRTLRCKGVYKMTFAWISGTSPTISGISYNG